MKWGSFIKGATDSAISSFSGFWDDYDKAQGTLTGIAARKAQEEEDAKKKAAAKVPGAPAPTEVKDATKVETSGGVPTEDTTAGSGGGTGPYSPGKGAEVVRTKGVPPAAAPGAVPNYLAPNSGLSKNAAAYVTDVFGTAAPGATGAVDFSRARLANEPDFEGPPEAARPADGAAPAAPVVAATTPAPGTTSALATGGTPEKGMSATEFASYGSNMNPEAGMVQPGPSVWSRMGKSLLGTAKSLTDPPVGSIQQRSPLSNRFSTPPATSQSYQPDPTKGSGIATNPALAIPTGGLPPSPVEAPAPEGPTNAPATSPYPGPTQVQRTSQRRDQPQRNRQTAYNRPFYGGTTQDPRYAGNAVPVQVAYLPSGPSLANTAVSPLQRQQLAQALQTDPYGRA